MANQSKNYFNLVTTGIGYLNEIKLVNNKDNASQFLTVKIAALVGDSEKPEYRYFNCIVAGENNIKQIQRCTQAVEAEKKVLLSFVLSDIEASFFVGKDGKTFTNFRSRLIGIKSIKVDGVLKYKSEPKKAEAQEQTLDRTADKAEIQEEPALEPVDYNEITMPF